MRNRSRAVMPVLLLLGPLAAGAGVVEPTDGALESRYNTVVRPILKAQCLTCHGPEKPKARLDLSGYASTDDVVRDERVWEHVLERVEAEEMPPEDAPRQLAADERQALVGWIKALRAREAQRNAGDPGPVLARRLSNAELDYTVRDLTGVDIRPTREFPVDPANEAGFDNSGESLAMSPALLKKYLAAARRVAEHLVLRPDGLFAFAPHAVVTETDRDKFCVQRIVAFYERHAVDLADYFYACWRYRNRHALGKADASLPEIADEAGLSPRYLATIWGVLTAQEWPESGPLGEVQRAWNKLPDKANQQDDVRRGCRALRSLVESRRKALVSDLPKLQVKGISSGSQPLILWWNRAIAARRMRAPDETAGGDVAKFCHVFPDAFFLAERAPYFDPKRKKSGRLLTAGFHLMQGYFRDDEPLCALVLDEGERRELDTLWHELECVTDASVRQYKDFIFFEREEPPMFMQEALFDFARSEDKDAAAPAKIERLRTVYLAKARRKGADDRSLEAMAQYFDEMVRAIRRAEEARRGAEPRHLDALEQFAARAYRRPLRQSERGGLRSFYGALRTKDGVGHEEAMRDVVASVLVSPDFCYRIDRAEPGREPQPLAPYELASRLSYFLWSSMPDDELLAHAAAGDLGEPAVLRAQTRRMLRDDRARGLATEFAGNWLGFRRFEEHNSVDRARFPSFTSELRLAMYEEPIRFFLDVVSRDRSVLTLLDADHTFVNDVLARHYGMPAPGHSGAWVRIDSARQYGRGGLLTMSVFLTANSPGLRTSPVKRGYWVVRRLLGEDIPAPPPEVPELPKDEAASGELSLPQLLERHRAHASCAGCHQRFDSVGLVFEGYGPIGETRTRDLGGRPVDTRATLPDGRERSGIDGLRQYLAERRRDEFFDNLCRKLLAYALGRSLRLSDDLTVRAMRQRLDDSDYRMSSLIDTIVVSPQFLNKRGRDDPRP